MNIFESINAVMKDIGAVGKDSKNTTQGFMFRGIDAVMNAINPALTKNKVFVVPEILDQTREERVNAKGTTLIYSICKVKYTFYAEDGSNVFAIVIGEGMDTGDKATNKAMSIAFKYACFQVFCIPTEEMKDPDAECHEVKPKKPQQKPAEKKEDTAEKPQNAQQTAEFLKARISKDTAEKLVEELNKRGIKLETVCSAYNVQDVVMLTNHKYKNLIEHYDDLLRIQGDK